MERNEIEKLVNRSIEASGLRRSKDIVYEGVKRRLEAMNLTADEYEYGIKCAVKVLKI
jgi:hypothetical protein